MPRIEILGTGIDNLTMDEAIQRIVQIVDSQKFSYAVTPNVDHLMRLRRDASMRSVYGSADLVLADGVPLLWASALLGTRLKERVNGTDLFERLCQVASMRGYSIYLLGGNPGAAEATAEVLSRRNPGLRVAGWDCPKHGFERDPVACKEVQRRIAATKPTILFVALGAPKQEQWIEKYAEKSGALFAVGIGISFSLVCGELKRAPRWMQRAGFEWLWRLCTEPRRLWKRYLLDDMPFITLVGQEWIRKHITQSPSKCLE